jgi:hypothetical protein
MKESVGTINVARRRLLARQAPLILWMPRLQKCFSTRDAVFGVESDVVAGKYSEIVPGVRTTLPLVGYTDAGFVVRNNWGAVGHTLGDLFGEMSADIDRRECPNERDVSHWVPAELECIKNMKGGEACITDLHWNYENVSFGARQLGCVNDAFCNMSATYFMSRGESGFVLDESSFPEMIEL